MRIGLVGTHSTGKTTAVKILHERLGESYIISTNFSRILKDLGFSLNKESSEITQNLQMDHRLSFAITNDNFISDRTIYDVFAYTSYNHNSGLYEDSNILQNQENILKKFPNLYDIIFFFPSNILGLEIDGIRDDDEIYRHLISGYIERALDNYCKTPIFDITQENLEDRIEFMMGKIYARNI